VLPTPSENIRQIVSAKAWYIWQGAIFRVPLSTLQKRKEGGGWGLTDVEAKCRALLLYRTRTLSQRDGQITAQWQRYWNLHTFRGNPRHVQRIPKSLEYLRIHALEMAYVEHPKQSESLRAFRTRLYGTLRTMKLATNKRRDVRNTLLYPTTDWDRVWSNLHETWASDVIKANWFKVIHDILLTNERLHTIRLTNSVLFSTCGERDTTMHRITECGEGRKIWEWTRQRIAWILRMDPARIPQEWTLRPQFHIWPPRRHRAVLWITAHKVWYRLRESRTSSAQQYLDFLRRARWKAY
jgi:hypothetical protein